MDTQDKMDTQDTQPGFTQTGSSHPHADENAPARAIASQRELDQALASSEPAHDIVITADREMDFVVDRPPASGGTVQAVGSVHVTVQGQHSMVYAYMGASVTARSGGDAQGFSGATVTADVDGHVSVFTGAKATINNGGRAHVWGNAKATINNGGKAEIYAGATAIVNNGGEAMVHEKASVTVNNGGKADAREGASVTVNSGGVATAHENATVTIHPGGKAGAAAGSFVAILSEAIAIENGRVLVDRQVTVTGFDDTPLPHGVTITNTAGTLIERARS